LRRVTLPRWCEPVSLLVALLVCLGLPMNTNPGYHLDAYDRQLNSWLAAHSGLPTSQQPTSTSRKHWNWIATTHCGG
ncbi:MAG: hypothetical protein ACXVBV_19910, partial [Isosphaeraceae bacterium]